MFGKDLKARHETKFATSCKLAGAGANQTPYYLYLSYSGDMMATPFFQGLNSTFQQNCINANIAEGQATNPANSQALGTQSCP